MTILDDLVRDVEGRIRTVNQVNAGKDLPDYERGIRDAYDDVLRVAERLNRESTTEGSLPVGQIVISYFLNGDGEPKIDVDRPEFTQVPALTQLGMVAYANHDVLHGSGEEEID